jgi:cell division protein FtsA
VLNEEDKKNGVVVVNIGNELTEISIFHKHGLRYRKVIPIAGRTITADIAEAFRLQIEEAEKLKLVYSVLLSLESITEEHTILVDGKNGLPSRQIRVEHIRRIVDLRLREIALIVSAEMTRSGLRDQLIHGCILTGGTANMYQIVDLFSSVLGEEIYTRVGSHLQNIAYVQGEESTHLQNPKYTTAIGLMLASLKPFDARFPDYTELLLQPTSYATPQIPTETTEPNRKQMPKRKDETSNIISTLFDRFRRNSPPDVDDSY